MVKNNVKSALPAEPFIFVIWFELRGSYRTENTEE